MKFLKVFLSGLLAGFCIAIAGWVFITLKVYCNGTSIDNFICSFSFSFGLLAICGFGLCLYTGKIGYVFHSKKSYLLDLLLMLIGNYAGCLIIGLLASSVRTKTNYSTILDSMVEAKANDSWYSLLFLGIMCGILVYIGVDTFKNNANPIVKVFVLILAVTVFVACSFEHVVADMFYFAAEGKLFTLEALYVLSLVGIGNSIGSIVFHEIKNLVFKPLNEEKKIDEKVQEQTETK